MVKTLVGVLLSVALGSSAGLAQDKAQLIGKVYDSRTGQVLPTAIIALDGVKADVSLSNQARFVLSGVEPGERRILIRVVGYKPFTGFLKFEAGRTLEKTFELEFTGEQMPELEVEARNSKTLPRFVEFERRRDRGVGHFIGRDEISARGYMNMGDALRTVKGVKVYCDALDCRARMARAARDASRFTTSMASRPATSPPRPRSTTSRASKSTEGPGSSGRIHRLIGGVRGRRHLDSGNALKTVTARWSGRSGTRVESVAVQRTQSATGSGLVPNTGAPSWDQ